jgi:hypothetical protein
MGNAVRGHGFPFWKALGKHLCLALDLRKNANCVRMDETILISFDEDPNNLQGFP